MERAIIHTRYLPIIKGRNKRQIFIFLYDQWSNMIRRLTNNGKLNIFNIFIYNKRSNIQISLNILWITYSIFFF